ncbi:MAG: hypothetical protein IPN11_05615 [Opitutaceae bacterium]|nr:hypothetical protein [Opitutaceae bacterium]
MSVKLKFASLLGLSLMVFVSAMWALQWLDRRETARNATLLHRSREQQLDHWLTATGVSLRNFTDEGPRSPRPACAPIPRNSPCRKTPRA